MNRKRQSWKMGLPFLHKKHCALLYFNKQMLKLLKMFFLTRAGMAWYNNKAVGREARAERQAEIFTESSLDKRSGMWYTEQVA